MPYSVNPFNFHFWQLRVVWYVTAVTFDFVLSSPVHNMLHFPRYLARAFRNSRMLRKKKSQLQQLLTTFDSTQLPRTKRQRKT